MSPVVECLAWVGGTWMAIAIAAAWAKHRLRRQPPLPQRTPADARIDDTELADWLAIGVADYQAETDYNPQAGLDRLRNEIQQQREEGDR